MLVVAIGPLTQSACSEGTGQRRKVASAGKHGRLFGVGGLAPRHESRPSPLRLSRTYATPSGLALATREDEKLRHRHSTIDMSSTFEFD